MRVVDLFAGCGGLSLGFEKAGFNVVAAYDNWQEACIVYEANFDHPIYQVDLAAIKETGFIKKWSPDVVIGGPPCQDFSSAGKRDECLGRADLTLTFAELVAEAKPAWFVMENVERILKSKVLKQAQSLLREAGYGLSCRVLDASYCSVPQSRKRFFMVGNLASKDNFLDHYFERNLSSKPMTVFDYMGQKLPIAFYYRHPRSYARRGIYSVHEPSATIRGVNRPIPSTYERHPGDPCPVNASLRPLTTLERSYIQTFPEGFKWIGSKTNVEQMIGNAVPVNLGKYVAECIQQYIVDLTIGEVKLNRGSQQLALF
jgi:DNA (cytosine-5)-methyltransferase 1